MLHFTWVILWIWTLCAGWAHEGWGFALNQSRRTPSPVPVLISSPSPANPPVANGHGGTDGHGSVRFLTDGAGAVTDTYAYDAYGDVLSTTGSTVNPYRYTGEPWDSDLGMHYLRARYYKPDLGRFWTMDTYMGNNADPQSLHKYLYCHGDGVNFSDPSGYYEGLGGLAVTMGSGAILGGFSAAAVDIAKGRAVTPLSVVQGAMWGAFLGPFAVEYQAVRVGLGVLSVEFSGLTAYEVFTDPHSSSAQKTMALGMVVASVYGTQVAMQYSRNPSIALPKVPYEGSMPQAKTTSVPVEIPISVKPGNMQYGVNPKALRAGQRRTLEN